MLTSGLVSAILLSACTPGGGFMEEEVEKTEKKNKETQEQQQKDNPVAEGDEMPELSKEQQEVLDQLEGDVNTALEKVEKDKEKNIKIVVPAEKDKFTEPVELAQYISAKFYDFHVGKLTPEEFYEVTYKHYHKDFSGELPKNRDNILATFSEIQKVYKTQLNARIESYNLTEVHVDQRLKNEATFYRRYNMSDDKPMYFKTVLKLKDDQWLLVDDSPSPPYIEMNFSETEMDGAE